MSAWPPRIEVAPPADAAHPMPGLRRGVQCCHQVRDYDGRGGRAQKARESGNVPGQCERPAAVLVDGEPYCMLHARIVVFDRARWPEEKAQEEPPPEFPELRVVGLPAGEHNMYADRWEKLSLEHALALQAACGASSTGLSFRASVAGSYVLAVYQREKFAVRLGRVVHASAGCTVDVELSPALLQMVASGNVRMGVLL